MILAIIGKYETENAEFELGLGKILHCIYAGEGSLGRVREISLQ